MGPCSKTEPSRSYLSLVLLELQDFENRLPKAGFRLKLDTEGNQGFANKYLCESLSEVR